MFRNTSTHQATGMLSAIYAAMNESDGSLFLISKYLNEARSRFEYVAAQFDYVIRIRDTE